MVSRGLRTPPRSERPAKPRGARRWPPRSRRSAAPAGRSRWWGTSCRGWWRPGSARRHGRRPRGVRANHRRPRPASPLRWGPRATVVQAHRVGIGQRGVEDAPLLLKCVGPAEAPCIAGHGVLKQALVRLLAFANTFSKLASRSTGCVVSSSPGALVWRCSITPSSLPSRKRRWFGRGGCGRVG